MRSLLFLRWCISCWSRSCMGIAMHLSSFWKATLFLAHGKSHVLLHPLCTYVVCRKDVESSMWDLDIYCFSFKQVHPTCCSGDAQVVPALLWPMAWNSSCSWLGIAAVSEFWGGPYQASHSMVGIHSALLTSKKIYFLGHRIYWRAQLGFFFGKGGRKTPEVLFQDVLKFLGEFYSWFF